MARAREKILRAAERLILTGGYHATGTNAIIAAAKVSKGSFFYHFPHKRELAKVLLERYFAGAIEGPLTRTFELHTDAKEALIAYTDEFERNLRKNRYCGGCLLGNLALELGDGDGEIRETLAGLFARWRELLVDLLEEPESDPPPAEFANLFIAQLEGVILTIKAEKCPEAAANAFEACRQFVARAFARPEGPPPEDKSQEAGHFYHAQLAETRARN